MLVILLPCNRFSTRPADKGLIPKVAGYKFFIGSRKNNIAKRFSLTTM